MWWRKLHSELCWEVQLRYITIDVHVPLHNVMSCHATSFHVMQCHLQFCDVVQVYSMFKIIMTYVMLWCILSYAVPNFSVYGLLQYVTLYNMMTSSLCNVIAFNKPSEVGRYAFMRLIKCTICNGRYQLLLRKRS